MQKERIKRSFESHRIRFYETPFGSVMVYIRNRKYPEFFRSYHTAYKYLKENGYLSSNYLVRRRE